MYVSFSVTGSADLIKKALKDAGPGFAGRRLADGHDQAPGLLGDPREGRPARYSRRWPSAAIPRASSGCGLRGNKDWKQGAGPSGKYWEWQKAGIQMSIPNNCILLASNGGIDAPARPVGRARRPHRSARCRRDMQTADLVLYMPELPGGTSPRARRRRACAFPSRKSG